MDIKVGDRKMRVGIASRPNLDGTIELTQKIVSHLKEKEIETFLNSELAEGLNKKSTPVKEMKVDSLITLGGDGTVLRNTLKLPKTPILGINMGGRGFLADVPPEESLEAIEKMTENELEIMKRERLKVEISGEKIADALNEGVVRLQDPSSVLKFKVIMDGEEVEKANGDGIIVATPTGSTAYSLSAGGPVMDPRIDAFLAVPLATYKPKALPLVFSMDSKIRIELLEPEKTAYVTIDGQINREVQKNDEIVFEKSENSAEFYKWKNKFYEKIKEKL